MAARIDWPAREAMVEAAIKRLREAYPRASHWRPSHLERVLGMYGSGTVIRTEEEIAVLPNERAVLGALDRLEARGVIVRRRKSSGARTVQRVYVMGTVDADRS